MYNPKLIEESILQYWGSKKIFNKVVKKNRGKKNFSFIDGPITANNPMGVHHAWGRTYKDVYQRFKALQGYDQRYQNGFDCQGLWVEVEAEKDLKFNSKRDIEEYGLANFSEYCKNRVKKFAKIQTEQSIRLGQWMDWENSYYTMSDHNIESIWFFLKKCSEKKWLYEGKKVMPWCFRCGTSSSQHEMADSYKEVSHTSIFLKLPVKDRKKEYFLVWTTTPWTLTANTGLAVNPILDYVKAEKDGNIYYLSKGTIDCLGKDYKILDTFKGKNLIDLEYIGPFDYLPIQRDVKRKVFGWDGVGEEEGTGIVHIAPGCGAEDYDLGIKEKLSIISPLDENGIYLERFDKYTGKSVRDVTKDIINDLETRNKLFKTQQYMHRYPFCWRCGEELIFRLVEEWFISCDEIRPLMKKEAKKVGWYPPHTGKLMQDWLINMQDWCISRKRYWGLPLPFWKCSSCNCLEIIGSIKELKQKAIAGLNQLREIHKPWIDNVILKCSKCKGKMYRIKETGDCWLDAGIIPFSTLKYFTDKNYWKKWFPADLVIEMREQVRLWFYSLLFMSVTLENRTPYKKVLAYEKVNDETGRPMHKSLGNAIWFDEAVEKMGSDVMRWIYSAQNPQFNLNFGYKKAGETKQILNLLININNYINQSFEFNNYKPRKVSKLEIEDRWILSKLNNLIKEVTESLENLKPHSATSILENFFTEDLSRTYIQFIRDRIQTKEGKNKEAALYTLDIVLSNLLTLLAPFIPFLVEYLYLNSFNKKKRESIFLEDWPNISKKLINNNLEEDMLYAKIIIQNVLAEREKLNIGIRWPLSSVIITIEKPDSIKRLSFVIKKQINIKNLIIKKGKLNVKLDTKLTPELEKEGLTREVVRRIQDLRKKAGLKKTDLINLILKTGCILDEKILKEMVNAKTINKILKPKYYDKFEIKNKKIEIGFSPGK